MQFLKLNQINKSYGEKTLFKDLNLTISKGQKIALIARNGSGKSTLLRIIAGEEAGEGENASIEVATNIKISFLKQEPEFQKDDTVLDAIYDSENPKIQLLKNYEKASLVNDQDEIQKIMLAIDDLKAWDFDARIKETLGKLNIKNLQQPVQQLSGGQRKRVALAKLMIEEPEFIIMDEPTNHLDLDMIEWLEEYLSADKITLLMVTHDRYFLERICTEIIEIDNGSVHTYRGNYTDFLEKKAARIENEAANFGKLKKLYKKELAWVRRQPSARGTKAKSRVDKFHDIKSDVKSHQTDEEMQLHVQTSRLGGKILEAHAIGKTFEDIQIVNEFSYKFRKGERLGIVGPNGSGKSTLINLLTKNIRPDSGKIVVGDTVTFGYYHQEGFTLDSDKRVIDVIRDVAEYIPLDKGKKLSAEQLLERFLFPRPQQQVYASKLSGGERRRLYLLKVLMGNPNFLILDEPTNDLDIITLNILEEYLMQFPGCLIIVSHDRFLLDKLVEHLFILDHTGNIKDYNGKYSEYRKLKKAEKYAAPKQEKVVSVEVIDQKERKKRKNKINNLEKKMTQLENKKKSIEKQFEDSSLSMDKIQELSKELQGINKEIDETENEWLELSED